jgi:sorbitol-specific phosphotransferase system component IIBC
LARATKTIQGDSGGFESPASVECGHARKVHAVIAAAGATSHDHIVYFGGVETVTGMKAIQDLGQNALRVHIVECACLFALATW